MGSTGKVSECLELKEPLRGLNCGILECKQIGNCSAGGISSKYKSVILLTNQGLVLSEEERNAENVVMLESRFLFGRDYVTAHPVTQVEKGQKPGLCGPMAGGCFIHSCDSRFPADYPIPLHDRYETPEQFEALSQ